MNEDLLLTPELREFIRREICLPCVHWSSQRCDEESKYCELNRKAYVAILRKLEAQLAKVLKHKETACRYCDKEADGPMLVMGSSMAHSTCVIQKLNELLDPDFEGKGDPSKIVGFLKHPSKKDRPELTKLLNNLLAEYFWARLDIYHGDKGATLPNTVDQLLLLCPDEEEIKTLKAEIEALHRERKGEVWYWQGDAEDHLESLTCPVLIEAQELRDLMEEIKTSERERIVKWWEDLTWRNEKGERKYSIAQMFLKTMDKMQALKGEK